MAAPERLTKVGVVGNGLIGHGVAQIFAAAGYPPDQAARFIAKLKAKIAEGLALANRSTE